MIASDPIRCGLIGIACYVVPKVLTFLCTKPERPDEEFLGHLRERMYVFQEKARSILGEHLWLFATDVVADNAWISVIAISCLTKTPFASVAKIIDTVTAFFCFCSVAAGVRLGIAKLFPPLAPMVGTRSL